MPDDEGWIMWCLNFANKYIEFVCGQAPVGSENVIMWYGRGLWNSPSMGTGMKGCPGNYTNGVKRDMELIKPKRPKPYPHIDSI